MNRENVSSKFNEVSIENLNRFPDFKVVCHLKEYMDKIGMGIEQLYNLTGIRTGTLSEMMSMKRTTINVHHMIIIATCLNITNMSDLFTFEMSEETRRELDHKRENHYFREMEQRIHDNRMFFKERAEENKLKKEKANS